MEVDHWGFMILNDLVEDLGYNMSYCEFYTLGNGGLIDMVSDLEACNLLNFENKQREVEIWVVIGEVGIKYEGEISKDNQNGSEDSELDPNMEFDDSIASDIQLNDA